MPLAILPASNRNLIALFASAANLYPPDETIPYGVPEVLSLLPSMLNCVHEEDVVGSVIKHTPPACSEATLPTGSIKTTEVCAESPIAPVAPASLSKYDQA